MRSFKKFLIACGLCLGVGLAFGTSEVKAEITGVKFSDITYDSATRTYKVKLEDENPGPLGKEVELYFDSKRIGTINTLDPEYSFSENELIELVAEKNIIDGSYTPKMRVKYGGESDIKDGAPITPIYSLEINCDYSKVYISNLSGIVCPLPSTVESYTPLYSLDYTAKVELKASPRDKYIFDHWNAAGREETDTTIDGLFNSFATSYNAYSGRIKEFKIDKDILAPGESTTVTVNLEGEVSLDDFTLTVEPSGSTTNSQLRSKTPGTAVADVKANDGVVSKDLYVVLASQKYLGGDTIREPFRISDKTVAVSVKNKDITVGKKMNLSYGSRNVTVTGATKPEYITWRGDYIYDGNSFEPKRTGTYKLTPTLIYDDGSTVTTEPVYITVYELPKLEINEDKLRLQASIPEYAGDGNDSGAVKEFTITAYDGSGSELYNKKRIKREDDGNYRLDLEELVQELGDDGKFKDSKKINDIYFEINSLRTEEGDVLNISNASGTITVHKVTVSGENIETKSYFGLKGQEIKIKATPKTGYTFAGWEDGKSENSERTVTVSTHSDENEYRAKANKNGTSSSTTNTPAVVPTTPTTPGTGTGGNTNLDKVPKTGEGNAILWVLMVSVITIIGAGSAVYYKMKAPKKAEVNYEAQVRDVTFANPEALMQEKLNRRNNDSSRRK